MEQAPLHFMLVEDNPFDQQIFRQLLKRSELAHADLAVFNRAKDALEVLTSENFDCCLFDLNMPEHGGRWLLSEYQKSVGSDAAMIALTETRNPSTVTELMQQGAHGYIAKGDLSPCTLKNKISAALHFRDAQRALYQYAHEDVLTSLLNRHAFHKQLARLLPRMRKDGEQGILLFLDIDNFKQINDEHGHSIGDAVLKKFSSNLELCCRPQDILGRLGGDEFVIFMPNTPLSEAELIMNRLQYQLSAELLHHAKPINITTSIGAACFPTHGVQQDELLHVADQALYQSKRNGRARLSVYNHDDISA